TLLLSVGIGTQLDAAGIVVEEAITAILKRPAPTTSTVFLLQKGGSLFGAVIFSIVGRNTFFSVRKPAAGCQRCSPIRLGKRKSGDLFGLRSPVDLFNLLRLGGEETQLKISSFRITSSACIFRAFMCCTQAICCTVLSGAGFCFSSSSICRSKRSFAVRSISARCGYSFPLSSRWL